MGLFDGANKDEGSAADVARLLNIPVVLVLDAKAMAYTAAPLLYGLANFDKRLRIAGVIFNRVSSESHYTFLQQAAIDAGVTPLGYLPKDNRLAIESRHLGLHLPTSENRAIVDVAAELLAKHINLDQLILATQIEAPTQQVERCNNCNLTIAVAKDEAFCFSYQANIDRLNELGNVNFFSPLHDNVLPNADLLWLPGGYPELYLEQLAGNTSMLEAINAHHKSR